MTEQDDSPPPCLASLGSSMTGSRPSIRFSYHRNEVITGWKEGDARNLRTDIRRRRGETSERASISGEEGAVTNRGRVQPTTKRDRFSPMTNASDYRAPLRAAAVRATPLWPFVAVDFLEYRGPFLEEGELHLDTLDSSAEEKYGMILRCLGN